MDSIKLNMDLYWQILNQELIYPSHESSSPDVPRNKPDSAILRTGHSSLVRGILVVGSHINDRLL